MSVNPFFPPKPIPDTPENCDKCQCVKCPSFQGQSGLYCAKGEGHKAVDKKGCLCGECMVYQEHKLNIYFEEAYFCETGKIA